MAEVGDRNTRYFHVAATLKSRKKKIAFLVCNDGRCITDPKGISDEVLNHFMGIFKAQGWTDLPDPKAVDDYHSNFNILNAIQCQLTEEQLMQLRSTIQPLVKHLIGNGLSTFLSWDNWHPSGPLHVLSPGFG